MLNVAGSLPHECGVPLQCPMLRPQCLVAMSDRRAPPLDPLRPAGRIPKKMFCDNQYTVVSHAHSSQGMFDEGFTRIHIG
jgi:hypothetical protein